MTKANSKFLKETWTSIVECLGLLLSIIGFFINGLNVWTGILLFLMIIAIVVTIYSIWESHRAMTENAYPTTEKINNFMYNWLNDNGKSIIFSRDMSWAEDVKVKEVLEAKSKKNELTIILKESNSLTRELKLKGARVIEYGHLDYTPETRFTIVNYESVDAKVAIGKKDEMEVHRINKYNSSDIPIYNLSHDLIRFVKQVERSKEKSSEKNE